MADEVVASFAGPLNSFGFTLSVTNSTPVEVRGFGISGRTARFPTTFDSMGTFSGPATLVSTTGVDTEVVLVRLAGFTTDETIRFTGIDPDFTGDSSSGTRVFDLEGARFVALFADATTAFGEFRVKQDGTLKAVATK